MHQVKAFVSQNVRGGTIAPRSKASHDLIATYVGQMLELNTKKHFKSLGRDEIGRLEAAIAEKGLQASQDRPIVIKLRREQA